MKKINLLLLPLILLTSCGENKPIQGALNFKVLSPIGAPSLALASYATDKANCVITSSPSTIVPGAFIQGNEYDVIIFDLTKGATFIEKKNAPYKLARTLTKGNSYLLSLGNDTNASLDESDNIVSFGSPSIFNSIFEKMYGIKIDSSLAGVASAEKIAETGVLNGENVNYVILSEPYVTKALKANSKASVKYNIAEEWEKYSKKEGLNSNKGFDGFPQAGLFISTKLEEATDEQIIKNRDNFLSVVDYYCSDLENNNGKEIIDIITKGEEDKLFVSSDTFGLDSALLSQVLTGNKLSFNSEAYDVNGFFSEAKLTGFNSLNTTTFSKIYK